jgi:peptidyl-prolyl cis-trans isomerase C
MQDSARVAEPDHDPKIASPAVVPSKFTAGPVRWSSLGRWAKEPLLHFLLIGLVLFGAYGISHPKPDANGEPLRIELTNDDLRQLAVMWLAQGRPAPTPAQMQSLVEQKIAEEILSREAVALGLDRDDQVIKRRLAQKMDFLVADLTKLESPSAAALKAWFAKNAGRFAQPPHMSFRHLYFSLDKRGYSARADAAAVIARLDGSASNAPGAESFADPFMLRNYYGDATPAQMAKEFGPDFSEALFRLTPGSWQGPIQSGYGWHLIWIDSVEPGRVPRFEEVEADIKSAWLGDRYREIKRRAFDEMRSRYTIIVPPLDALDLRDLQISEGSAPELIAK